MNAITLIQNPIIKHNLVEIGKEITKRIEELNLSKQIATDDSIKYLKEIRATLNKEAKTFEEERKSIKDAVMNPYLDVEAVYKTEIIDKYKLADEQLKNSINTFELQLKTDKRDALKLYFEEVCKVEKLEWLSFDALALDVTLSVTEKKYKEQINEKISSITEDINLINTEEYAAEMLVEYKKTLKASQAIQDVRKRKTDEKIEAERIKINISNQRKNQLISLGFYVVENDYRLNNTSISITEIEEMTGEEWIKKYAEIKASFEVPTIQTPTIEVKQTPKEDVKLFVAKFSVSGTKEKLLELKEYLASNNYNYKNIE